MNLKQFIIIVSIIIALLTIGTILFVYMFFLHEGPAPSPEPKEKDMLVQETAEPSSVVPNYNIPGPQDKQDPSYAVPAARIPTPQEIEERVNKDEEKRKALEEIKIKTERQNEAIRAEAFQKLKEAEAALLSADSKKSNAKENKL